MDINSLFYRPGFTSHINLAPNATDSAVWALNGRAQQNVLVTSDIYGSVRSTTIAGGAPDVGAFEFTPTVMPPLATASPLAPLAGTTQVFTFAADTVAKIVWSSSAAVPSSIGMRLYSGSVPPASSTGDYFQTYWDVSAPTSSYDYTMQLYYKDAWRGSVSSESDSRLAKLNTSWAALTGSASVVDPARNIITATGLSSFSIFTGTSNSNPLPITLAGLSATEANGVAELKWSTVKEINSQSFVVERSIDNVQFDEAGNVPAAGFSDNHRNYTFSDKLNAQERVIYYRLRLVDRDGSYEFSRTVTVQRELRVPMKVSVFPNPVVADSKLHILAEADGLVRTTIMNSLGRIVATQELQVVRGSNEILFDGADCLETGVYYLTVNSVTASVVLKFVLGE
jgi:hypothetical protein